MSPFTEAQEARLREIVREENREARDSIPPRPGPDYSLFRPLASKGRAFWFKKGAPESVTLEALTAGGSTAEIIEDALSAALDAMRRSRRNVRLSGLTPMADASDRPAPGQADA